MMLKLAVLLTLLAAAAGYTVMFDNLGSFKIGHPYSGSALRAFPVLPLPIAVTFHLLTRNNPEYPEEFFIDSASIRASCFDPQKKTYFIIHGYTHSVREPWMRRMAAAILKQEDANCVLVDWSSGSMNLYIQTVQSIRTASATISRLITTLQEELSFDLDNLTMIGHSLGAQMAGMVGNSIKGIERITGLDPAGPLFYGEAIEIQLNRDSAKFVDVIITNGKPLTALGLGNPQPVGDRNYYVNGGTDMPECPAPDMSLPEMACLVIPFFGPLTCEDIGFPTPEQCEQLLGSATYTLADIRAANYRMFCSHFQAIVYYVNATLQPEKYVAHPCQSVAKCQQGETEPCSEEEGCPQMGFFDRPPAHYSEEPKLYHLKAEGVPLG